MGGRTTRQRKEVTRALECCQDFVSAQELYALLTADAQAIGLTTVYRALRELETDGGVDVVRDKTGGRLYRLRSADGHRHYLMCRGCGRSRPVDSDVVEEWAGKITTATGFTAVEHTVELTGVCAECLPHNDKGRPSGDRDKGEEQQCHWDRGTGLQGQVRSCAS